MCMHGLHADDRTSLNTETTLLILLTQSGSECTSVVSAAETMSLQHVAS